MPYEKHGRYDPEKGLPDNTGQPLGSGLYVWLHEQVEQHWPELLDQAKQQNEKSTADAWLLDKLKTMEDDQARAIVEEFADWQLREQAEDRQAKRLRYLARFEELLEQYPDNRFYQNKVKSLKHGGSRAQERISRKGTKE